MLNVISLMFVILLSAAPKLFDVGKCTTEILKNGNYLGCTCKAGMLYDAESGKCQLMYSEKMTCKKINPPECTCHDTNYIYQKIEKKCIFVPSHLKPIGKCNTKFSGEDCVCPSGYRLGSVEFQTGFNPKYCLRSESSFGTDAVKSEDEEDVFAPEGSEDTDEIFEDSKNKVKQ